LQPGQTSSKFKDVKGSGFEAHIRDIAEKAKSTLATVAQEIRHPKIPALSQADMNRRSQRPAPDPMLQRAGFWTSPLQRPYDIDVFEHLEIPRDAQPGVSPMIKDWKSVSAFALMMGAMLHGSTAAAIDGPPTDEEKLDNIQKQLNNLTRTLTSVGESSVKAASAVNDLKRDLTGELNSMQASITNIGLSQAKTTKGLDDLREEMVRLRSEVDTLRAKVQTNSNYQALYNPNSTVTTPVGMGRVEIVNTYASEVAVVLNRRAYYVAPGETRTIENVPAGNFTYEVLGIQPPVTRTISPDKIFTVRVYTR
jgi:hypothetical protein